MTSKGAFVNISLQHERRERTLNSGMRIDTPVERIVKTVLSIMVRMYLMLSGLAASWLNC
jgi:hypothetical protein